MTKAKIEQQAKYYINGKQYIPDKSKLLCKYKGLGVLIMERLYYSPKGAFFLVRECAECETKVEVIDREKAFEFMNCHTAGIVLENYDEVFGVPEMG